MKGGMSTDILKWLFVLLMAFCLSCIPRHATTSDPLYDVGIPRFDPIIFIKVDDTFTESQKTQIARAFRNWERASNYKISFQVTWDEPKPGPYWQYETPYEDSGLFFWYLPKNEDFIPIQTLARWQRFVGMMVFGRGENSGNVIIFDNVREEHFYSVALHEIGHLLGLKHIEDFPVVMHPEALGECISEYDVQQLCELYGCEPVSQCAADLYEDEPNKAIRTSSSLKSFSETPQLTEWNPERSIPLSEQEFWHP